MNEKDSDTDIPLTWQDAALMIGEHVQTMRPPNYDQFTPREWYNWMQEIL